MGDMLSQEEIDALLNGTDFEGASSSANAEENQLSEQEMDALGEIGNISMGTSATTLFTLLGQKVMITTPKVSVVSWNELCEEYADPYVAVRVEYKDGLIGCNLLLLRENDVRIITDLMMGGEGSVSNDELSDFHFSAISEAMNQMVGSSATSMSSLFDKRINITPPESFTMQFVANQPLDEFKDEMLVKIAFKMDIGDLIDSEIMQIIPIHFAKTLVRNLMSAGESDEGPQQYEAIMQTMEQPIQQNMQRPIQQNMQQPIQQNMQQPMQQNMQQPGQQRSQPPLPFQEPQYSNNQSAAGYEQTMYQEPPRMRTPVNVQAAQFQSFDEGRIMIEKKNINLIMDVPLQVTVELGRTQKLIKDILEFGSGSIIELDKLAGEPVDILVNSKVIAKGEVVVIDESFGVRITDIIQPSKRL